MAGIKLNKVSKYFDSNLVVNGFDLEIKKNEFVVFVGGSGCGKTTTLRMIAGFESVSEGEVIIEGEDVTNMLPGKRGISMVFQNYALYPHMTVKENLSFGMKNNNFTAQQIEDSIERTSKILELDQYLERMPKQLSGGQQQRVALGRAIIRQPKVYLFDEPLSNLDAKLRATMRREISLLKERAPATTVYVTHDQVEAMTLGDRIVVMDKGNIMQVGKPMDIYERPDNKFVASFIGTTPMNFLPAKVSTIKGVEYITVNNIEILVGANSELQHRSDFTVGIRPETLSLSTDEDDPKFIFHGRVISWEQLGTELIVTVEYEGYKVTVSRVPPSMNLTENCELSITMKQAILHVFDNETDDRIMSLNNATTHSYDLD